MSTTAFFFRMLLRSTAAFAGAAFIFLHPSLEWRGGEADTVVAQQAPCHPDAGPAVDVVCR